MGQKIIISVFLTTLSGIIVAADSSTSVPFDDDRRMCVPEGSSKMSEEVLQLSYKDPIEKKSFKELINNDLCKDQPTFVTRCSSAINKDGLTARSYYYCGKEFLNKHVDDNGTLKNREELANGTCPERMEFFVLACTINDTSFCKPRFAYLFNHPDITKIAVLREILHQLRYKTPRGTIPYLFTWGKTLDNTDMRKETAMVTAGEFSEGESLRSQSEHELGKYYFARNPVDKRAKRWLEFACGIKNCGGESKQAYIDLGKWYEAQNQYQKAKEVYQEAVRESVSGAQEALDALPKLEE